MPAHQGLDPWPLFTAGGSFGREQLHLSHRGDREDDQAEILATEELWHLKSQRVFLMRHPRGQVLLGFWTHTNFVCNLNCEINIKITVLVPYLVKSLPQILSTFISLHKTLQEGHS